jgi:hypothetical protein
MVELCPGFSTRISKRGNNVFVGPSICEWASCFGDSQIWLELDLRLCQLDKRNRSRRSIANRIASNENTRNVIDTP